VLIYVEFILIKSKALKMLLNPLWLSVEIKRLFGIATK